MAAAAARAAAPLRRATRAARLRGIRAHLARWRATMAAAESMAKGIMAAMAAKIGGESKMALGGVENQ